MLIYILNLYENICKYFYYILSIIKRNKIFIYRVLFIIVLGVFIYIFIFYIILICKDLHDQYIFALREGKVNFDRCVLEHKIYLNYVFNNTNTDVMNIKPNFIENKE
jgi:hypothetical protein